MQVYPEKLIPRKEEKKNPESNQECCKHWVIRNFKEHCIRLSLYLERVT